MKKLLVALLVLVALVVAGLVYADLRIREIAQATAQMKLQQALPQATDPFVEIESFPFVGRVLLNGTVEELRVGAKELRSRGVTVRDVRLQVVGLTIDRDKLLQDQRLVVTGIDRARIDAKISFEDVAKILKIPVKVKDGGVEVEYHGRTYAGRILVLNHLLTLNVEGLPKLVVPLPDHEYLPCEPALEIVGDHLEIACSTTTLPPAIANVLR